MNKIILFISLMIAAVLVNAGISTRIKTDDLRRKKTNLDADNRQMQAEIKDKESLVKREPVLLSKEYALLINQTKILESYSGTSMELGLEGLKDADDVADHYVDTSYRGIKGLKLCIMVDKFSKEADMGAVLDDIHSLEKNTDFLATQISQSSNNLIVKGELYGI